MTEFKTEFMNMFSVASELDYNLENASLLSHEFSQQS